MLLRSPIPALQPYIQSIWYCNTYIVREITLSLPFGRIELVINFSGDYHIAYPGLPAQKVDEWIAGQHTVPITCNIAGQHECIGIVFTTLGYNAICKMPASELANKAVPAHHLFGKEISILKSEIARLKTSEEKLQHLEQFFMKKISDRQALSTIKLALYIINKGSDKKKKTVTGLCRELKLSRNSLNRHFKSYIGISASQYLQVQLFNNVIRGLTTLPKERLIDTTYDHEFFDQAHFIKHFRRFAAMTPGQYLSFLKEDAIDKAYPNFISC